MGDKNLGKRLVIAEAVLDIFSAIYPDGIPEGVFVRAEGETKRYTLDAIGEDMKTISASVQGLAFDKDSYRDLIPSDYWTTVNENLQLFTENCILKREREGLARQLDELKNKKKEAEDLYQDTKMPAAEFLDLMSKSRYDSREKQ